LSTEAQDRMALTKEESDIFERRLALAKQELETVDAEIESALEQVRVRIGELQQKREAPLKMYDAACTMLGIANNLNSNGSDPKS